MRPGGPGILVLAVTLQACGRGSSTSPGSLTAIPTTPAALVVLGGAHVPSGRLTAELSVRGTVAYTTTWSTSLATRPGNQVLVWDVSGNVPVLLDSLDAGSGVQITGDVAVSDDGMLLVVATELTAGSIIIYDLASDPRHPRAISRFSTPETQNGVHTAEVGRVGGTLYAFLAVDQRGGRAGNLVIVDLSDPRNPRQVYVLLITPSFIHDTFIRDGVLFVVQWNAGVHILDLGGLGKGGTPQNPVDVGHVITTGGEVHNIWWFKNPVTGSNRYAFVGEEAPGSLGLSSAGDIHVVDVSDMTNPREVAFYHVPGAGTHNFSMDEPHEILYAAYYNGGVQAVDVRGDLSACTADQRASDGRCDLVQMGRTIAVGLRSVAQAYVWGVQYLDGFIPKPGVTFHRRQPVHIFFRFNYLF